MTAGSDSSSAPFKTNELAALARRHGLSLIYLFGSQAREGLTLLSGGRAEHSDRLADLDVGVVTSGPLPETGHRPALYSSLQNDLQDLFLPLRVDLVLLEEGHSVFQLEAVKGNCVYQVSEPARERYEMQILRRAADFGPVLRTFHREALEEV